MGVVAATAFTLDKGLMRHQVFCGLLRFLMACEAQGLSPGAQQIFIISCMLYMAGKAALLIGYRLVGNLDFRFFCFMTAKTQVVAGLGKQDRVLRRMGLMAGNTLPFLKRLVFDLAPGRKVAGFVALVAKRAAFLGDGKRLRGGCIVVAPPTGCLIRQRMRAGFEQIRLHRRVGCMTAVAGGGLHRIILVGLFKGTFLRVMAR